MFCLIKDIHVFQPEDAGILDILVCGEKIVAIGKNLSVEIPGVEVEIVDGRGKIAAPGFIDQHVHITGGGGESSFKSRIREIDPEDIAEGGVTTVVGLLGTDSTTRSIENLVAKTKALNEVGLTAFCLTGAYTYPSPTLTGSVTKDIAYIQEIIGCKLAITDHRSSEITKDELKRLATQVRMASLISGKAGVLHMHTGSGKQGLREVMEVVEESNIPIKHFRPTHCGHLVEDAVAFANMGGYIDFTAGSAQKAASTLADVIKRVPYDRVTLSSDSNGSMPMWNEKKELIGMGVGKITVLYEAVRYMITELGTPLPVAIGLITSNVAKALEMYPKKGCLAQGSDADITILDGEYQIDSVMARGKWLQTNKIVKKIGMY